MRAQQIKAFKKALLQLRAQLCGDVAHLEEGALDQTSRDGSLDTMAEVGSDSFAQDFTLGLMEADTHRIRQIDTALAAIEDGSYGICCDCGKGIPVERLKIFPFVRRCVPCKERFERGGVDRDTTAQY